MALSSQEVAIILKAQDQASAIIKSVSGDLTKLGNSAKQAGPSWLSMSSAVAAGTTAVRVFEGVAKGTISILGGALKTFGDFESQMNILKVTTGATDAQMASMSAQARALGADLDLPATSSTGAAIAMLELAKAGLSVDQTQQAAKGALQLAAAASIDEAKAAQLTAGALNAFGLEGSRATDIANQLAYAANASSLDATDLGQAVAQAGGIFKAVGQPIESFIASMIVLGNAGMSGSDGATAVKNALMQAINPTDQAKKAMQQYGISLFDAQGKMKDLPSIIDTLNERLGPLTEQQRNAALATIFQGDGMKALIPLMGAGGDKLREYEANLKTTNAAGEQAEARAKGLAGAWKGLTSQWETAQEALGAKLAPAIEKLIRETADGMGGVIPLMESIGEGIGNALVSGIDTAKDLFRQLTDAWRTVKQAFAGEWAPDASIEPLALAAGKAALKLKDLSEWAGRVRDAMSNNGALETFGRALETINVEAEGVVAQLRDLAGIGIDANDSMSGAAAAGKLLATGLELTALAVGQVADTFLSFIGLAVNAISVFGQLARAATALASGDMAAFDTAMVNAAVAVGNFATIGSGSMDRFVERASQGFASVTTAAQTSAPQVVAAVDEMGTGMVGALEAAAPAMAAAAESGAVGAVAAVEGQSGAARAAGTSVGQNLGAGMESGIGSYISRVAAKAVEMVRTALGAANAEAAIESPSKKTMYMGQMLDEGLIKGIEGFAPNVRAAMRDLIQSVTDYAPVAGEIARVEREINAIRNEGQTAALFRGEDMITIESELLRLKRDQTDEERRLLPIREDVAAAERAIRDITNGSLGDRSALLENDTERKQIRLQTLDLEKQLVGLDRDSKRAEGIQKQIDKLRDQDRLLGIEAERIRLTNDIAATSERRRVLGLGEILTAEERNIQAIGRQIAVLGAEEAVFRANEAIIKNATENEIAYRQRLIAVFNAEGKPLQDRMTAGLALVNQLEAEGKISKELADQLRAIGKEAGVSTTATAAMGTAAATAAPQIDAAAKKAKEMADQAGRIADEAKEAGKEVNALANMLGKLPSWMTPKGSSGGGTSKSVLFGDSVTSTATTRDVASLVQPVALAGVGAAPGGVSAAGPIQRQDIVIDLGGTTLARLVATGMRLELRRVGTLPGLNGGI